MSVQPADIFISHASEDKEEIARPLAEALRQRGLIVWYDDYVLRLGDSLREVIDKGLRSSRFGVVILSPAFFSKEWPRRELNGLLARETADGAKILLPVWHRVNFEDVVRFSPLLADKLAVSTTRGLDFVVQQILEVIESGKPVSRPEPAPPPSVVSARRDTSPAVEKRTEAPLAVLKRVSKEAPARTAPALPQASPAAPSTQPSPQPSGVTRSRPVPKNSRASVPGSNRSKIANTLTSRPIPRRMLALAAALSLLITVAGIWSAIRRQATLPDGPEEPTSTEITPASKPQSTDLDLELLALRDFEARQQIGSHLLVDVTKALPELLWLDRLAFGAEGVSIEGRAFNTNAIANFIENLDKLKQYSEPLLKEAQGEVDGIYGFALTFQHEEPIAIKQDYSANLQVAERDSLLHRLATHGQSAQILRQLRSLTEQSTLRLSKFLPDALQEAGSRIEIFPVSLRVGAASLHELALYLEQLRHFPRALALKKMVVTADGQQIAADLVLEILMLKDGVKLSSTAWELDGTEKIPLAVLPQLPREPFRSLVAEPAEKSADSPPEGVPGLLIDELEVTGLWRTSSGFVAQVVVQNGRKPSKAYLLKEGDLLYNGEVVSISKTEIVFRQRVKDSTAREPYREVVKSLSSP